MDSNQLRTFRIVATTLSFTRAAGLLGYVQSSVSAQIRALEEELGVVLFDRLGRRIELTEAGRRMLAYSEKILSLEEEARTAVVSGNGHEGVVRVGAPESVLAYRLPALLRKFRDASPNVQLHFRAMTDRDLYTSVMGGGLDFAFFLQPRLQVESLVVEALTTEALLIVASPDHPLATRARVEACDLRGQTILLTESGCGYRHLFQQELAEAGAGAHVAIELSGIDAIKRCAMAGLGVAFLPEMAVRDDIAHERLAALKWKSTPTVALQIAWHRQKQLSLPEARFAAACAGMAGVQTARSAAR